MENSYKHRLVNQNLAEANKASNVVEKQGVRIPFTDSGLGPSQISAASSVQDENPASVQQARLPPVHQNAPSTVPNFDAIGLCVSDEESPSDTCENEAPLEVQLPTTEAPPEAPIEPLELPQPEAAGGILSGFSPEEQKRIEQIVLQGIQNTNHPASILQSVRELQIERRVAITAGITRSLSSTLLSLTLTLPGN